MADLYVCVCVCVCVCFVRYSNFSMTVALGGSNAYFKCTSMYNQTSTRMLRMAVWLASRIINTIATLFHY